MRIPSFVVSVLLLALVGAACSAPGSSSAPALTLFVAASLANAVDAAATAYHDTHDGIVITTSTGSSTALRTQIEQGAPADVFLSADTANPQVLADEGLTSAPPVVFAGNALAIVVPAGNRAGVSSAADLGRPGLRVVAAGEKVPISGYAATLLQNLARLPAYPPDLPAMYSSNVVSREDDVRAVLAKVELGEGDAAIVYATDARASAKIRLIAVPEAAQVRVNYSAVVLARAAGRAAATDFITWLAGAGGQATLSRFGFLAP